MASAYWVSGKHSTSTMCICHICTVGLRNRHAILFRPRRRFCSLHKNRCSVNPYNWTRSYRHLVTHEVLQRWSGQYSAFRAAQNMKILNLLLKYTQQYKNTHARAHTPYAIAGTLGLNESHWPSYCLLSVLTQGKGGTERATFETLYVIVKDVLYLALFGGALLRIHIAKGLNKPYCFLLGFL